MVADPGKKSLIIVESPTKAKTISKYLPSTCTVKASKGHVVDLNPSPDPKGKGLYGVDVENGFALDYVVAEGKEKMIAELRKDLKGAEQLILASDEDREGESIAWHLLNELNPKVPVYRMVFHEITKKAITAAFSSCRDIDMNLVMAQEARRTVDRLQGYGISPILSQKLGGAYSAGRVQSPALKMIVEREKLRRSFVSSTYSGVEAVMEKDGTSFTASLTHVGGVPVATGKSFDSETGRKKGRAIVLSAEEAEKISGEIKGSRAVVREKNVSSKVEKPAWPFTTSTLQQDAIRKMGKSGKEVMQIAQKLYENGYITYMRTDSPTLSSECVNAAASYIRATYGDSMVQMRQFKARTPGAQEAHEAIRPAGDHFRTPEETGLRGDELRLYTLIWKRTIASLMKDSVREVTTVTFDCGDYAFSSSGSVIRFEGFRKLYMASSDKEEEKSQLLPSLGEGEEVNVEKAEEKSHSTVPPVRFTEASLVQKLESEEIGRPSTYATIVSTIVDRGYVVRQAQALVPTFTGFFVNSFLERAFPLYIGYDFTKDMEAGLDSIARGECDKEKYLSSFWFGDREKNIPGLSNDLLETRKGVRAGEAKSLSLPGLNGSFTHDGKEVRYEIKTGKFGPYILSSPSDGAVKGVMKSIPSDMLPGSFSDSDAEALLFSQKEEETVLYGRYVLKTGRWGDYLEDRESGERASWPKASGDAAAAGEDMIRLIFSLPKTLGEDSDGESAVLKAGPFGFYVQYKGKNIRVADPVSVTFEDIVSPGGGGKVKGELDGKPIELRSGRYGLYIKWGNDNIPLSKKDKEDEASLTLERITEIAKAYSSSRSGAPSESMKTFSLPDGSEAYLVDGRYGAYVKWNGENVALSSALKAKGTDISVDDVLGAIEAHKAKPKTSGKKRYTKKS